MHDLGDLIGSRFGWWMRITRSRGVVIGGVGRRDMRGGREKGELPDCSALLQYLCLCICVEDGNDPEYWPERATCYDGYAERDQCFSPLADVEISYEEWNTQIQCQCDSGTLLPRNDMINSPSHLNQVKEYKE